MYYTKARIEEKSAEGFTAIASSERQDRQGEVVEIKGWELKNFKDNPILLYMHDHMKPIGKASRIWIDKTGKKPLLKFKGVISEATEWGRAAKQLMDEGILKAFSVGFQALEMEGTHITKADLYEISLVSVPANPEARVLAAKSLKNAGFDEDLVDELSGGGEAIEKFTDELAKVKKTAEKAQEQAELAVKGLQHLAPHRSKDKVAAERLRHSKVIAKAADKLLSKDVSGDKAVLSAKIIKRSSEMLIRDLKGDL